MGNMGNNMETWEIWETWEIVWHQRLRDVGDQRGHRGVAVVVHVVDDLQPHEAGQCDSGCENMSVSVLTWHC